MHQDLVNARLLSNALEATQCPYPSAFPFHPFLVIPVPNNPSPTIDLLLPHHIHSNLVQPSFLPSVADVQTIPASPRSTVNSPPPVECFYQKTTQNVT